MKKRILVLVSAMMMICSVAFAHVTGGSINALQYLPDGGKMVIYTQEGYSVALVLEFPADNQMEASDIIEAVDGYLTEIGKVHIHDLRSGSSRNLIHIVGVKLSEKEALRWLADGGQFLR